MKAKIFLKKKISNRNTHSPIHIVMDLMIEYAKLKCKEQRKMCQENLKIDWRSQEFEGVEDAPEPKF